MARPSIAQVDVSRGIEGHLLRVFQFIGDDDLRRGQTRGPDSFEQGVTLQLLAGKNVEPALRAEAQAAGLGQRNRTQGPAGLDVDEYELLQAAEAQHGHAVMDGHAAELLAPVHLAGSGAVDAARRGEDDT